MTPGLLAGAIVIAFVAGVIDAMAGGGGILTMPVIAAFGLPVARIGGTNKMVGVCGSATATLRFLLRGKVDRAVALVGGVGAALGGCAGARALIGLGRIDERLAKGVIALLLGAMALYMGVKPEFGASDGSTGRRPGHLGIAAGTGLVLGFYDGFFGPGTGSLLVFVMVRVLKFDFVVGTGNAKCLNFASNLASLATFIAGGQVGFAIALPMGAANAAGAWIGASLAIRRGARFVRGVFLAVALGIVARLVWFLARGS